MTSEDYDIHLDDKYGSIEDRATVVLHPHKGYTVPHGVLHRTRAPRRTAILMIESAGVMPTGDQRWAATS